MIQIKNKLSIQKMAYAGHLLAEVFCDLENNVKQGVSTASIDAWIATQLQMKGLVSRTKGYRGYRHVSCISINNEVVHGVPCENRIIHEGDLVKVDVCASFNGYCADMARSFFVGERSLIAHPLITIAQTALQKGIEKACVGNKLSDISAAIQKEVETHGCGVVRDFAGHGIGKQMHEEPEVLNYGVAGQGPVLREGMTLAIEPMITVGKYDVYIEDDGWTVKTVDESLAAHVEDTIVITNKGPIVLTSKNSEYCKT